MTMGHWAKEAGRGAGRVLLDFVLPPRCPACGDITEQLDVYCPGCWGQLQFLGGGCATCGLPLPVGDSETCGACLVDSGPIDRTRAALAYGDIPRTIATRLKYGRRIALARTMANAMRRPLGELSSEALLVPVPLHRWRLWRRGFNQALLIARALGREVDPDLLRRTRATRRLKGLNPSERRNMVRGAFDLRPGARFDGRDIILVDDVITTGATAEACARTLRKAGAGRIELLAFARVLR